MRRSVLRCLVGLSTVVLPACTGMNEHRRAPASVSARLAPVLDGPALVGLPVDGLKSRLGPTGPLPVGFVVPMSPVGAPVGTAPDPAVSFRAKGLLLVVAYDYRNRRVNDLLLLGSDEDSLLQRADLTIPALRYLVLPVFREGRANRLLGIRLAADTQAN